MIARTSREHRSRRLALTLAFAACARGPQVVAPPAPPPAAAPPALEPAAAPENDADHDGVPSPADACPDAAEDVDGWEDVDGCPDPDNDGDGVLDMDDRCPMDPELVNGYEDEDGCPDDPPLRVGAADRR
ncbi:MAG: hypothetical protein R3A79_22200 [Nannocystaceae bacterium]